MTDSSPDPTDRRASRTLEARIEIAAPPSAVWQVVSDLTRTGQWSPECRRVWVRGPVQEGATVIGLNRRGLVTWVTRSRIRSYEPLRRISWRVKESGARWTYELEPTDTGTTLVERRETSGVETVVGRAFSRVLLGGAQTHTDELADGMRYSLRRIKDIVEGSATSVR